ncbi:putative gustatory receptor clone PTE01 [Sus scrofa]|uniref:putative gustatory receptor clone PTE01 n=1 Tax=Sus scrofa TaxID=9823 RepID=UPI000A2AEFF2|nr:putative gustatory receptor clone PTE01 [Sus scrofa]
MIVNIQTHSRVISYVGCLTQMSFFILFGHMVGTLLTVMAYDRFVAICPPTALPRHHEPTPLLLLSLVSVFVSLLDSQLHNLLVLQVACFKDVEISNFFCHPSQLLKLACFDTFTNTIIVYFVGTISGFSPYLRDLFLLTIKLFHQFLRVSLSAGNIVAISQEGLWKPQWMYTVVTPHTEPHSLQPEEQGT